MNRDEAPYWILRFVRWFCPTHLFEEIEGDLLQRYNRDAKKAGIPKAKRRLVWNAIRFFRPGILFRSRFSFNTNPFFMLKHFFKVFFRTTLNNGVYSFINISGLTIGLAGSILIMLWVRDEISFDKFHKDVDRIYKVMGHHKFPGGIATYDDTPGLLAGGLMDFPEVEASCRLTFRDQTLLKYEDQSTYQRAVLADHSIFDILSISILSGGKRGKMFPNDNSIVISRKVAETYFGENDAVGKIFRVDNKTDFLVTAVFENMPDYSSIQFDLIVPYNIYAKEDPYNNEWGAWTGGQTYVKLRGGADLERVTTKMHDTFTKPKIWVRWGTNVELILFPLSNLRLYGNFQNGIQQDGRIRYVTAFSVVAAFILLIACVNFINLTTARSLTRAREIGVRKIVGAARRSLVSQFLGESILISCIASLLALLLVHLALPEFNNLTEKRIHIDYGDPIVLTGFLGITLLTGLVAGSYPAFLLSSFKPVNVFKSALPYFKGNALRKGLVVIQFSLSVILIISAIIVYNQVDYMHTKDLGFDRKNVFYLSSNEKLRKNFSAFKANAEQNMFVKKVAQSDANPMEIFSEMVLGENAWPGKRKEDEVEFKYLRCDDELLLLMNFTFLDGRNFSPEFPADSTNYIINEEAARQMSLADPIGQYLVAPRKGQIVGVIKDFHSEGLKNPVQPVIIGYAPQAFDRIFVRYESGHLQEAITHVTKVYKNLEPDFPLNLSFMDATFGQQYQDEIMLGKLSVCFTMMAVFISCLGLFGLASFTAGKRSKEIGVRKVLGASVLQLVFLLCRDFMRLIVIALILGLPVSWWIMREFLHGYSFHTNLGITPFFITTMSLISIALMTVAWQSARVALSNPVNHLKCE